MSSSPSRSVTAGGAVAFFVMGLLAASYGPLLPGVRGQFDLSAATGGLLLSAHFTGSVAGVLGAGALSRRVPLRGRLAVAAALVTVGALTAAAAPTWSLLLAGVAVAGLGWGGFELDVNVLFSRAHGVRSSAVLNAVSAAFGAGAVAAPVLVGAGAGRAVVLTASAVMALAALALLRDAPRTVAVVSPPRASGPRRPGRLWGVFVLILLVYVAAESGTAGWMPTYLSHLSADLSSGTSSYDGVSAGEATAGFWVCFTLGRLLAAPVSLHLRPSRLVPTTLLLATLTTLLGHSTSLAPYAFAATGLFLAPVFPTTLAWQATRTPTAAASTALVLAAASLGPVLTSPLIGAIVDRAGTSTLPTALAALTALAAALALGVRDRRSTSDPAAAPAAADRAGSGAGPDGAIHPTNDLNLGAGNRP